jgi:hypothetical protein
LLSDLIERTTSFHREHLSSFHGQHKPQFGVFAASASALLLSVAVAGDASRLLRNWPPQKAAMSAVEMKEKTMRSISETELSRLTRSQLFVLYTQMQATLADLDPASPEYQFVLGTLSNIKRVLFRKVPTP